MKVYIKTFGCSVNKRDSENIAGILKKEGFKLTKERDEWKKKAEEFLSQRNNYFNQLNKIKHFLNSNQLQDDENHGRKSNGTTQNNT